MREEGAVEHCWFSSGNPLTFIPSPPLPSPLQYMREQVYQFSADVWSSMAVAVEMITGKDPWSAVNQDALVLIVSGGNATLSVAMQHCRWQCNIVGGNATLSVAMQHCRWQCNIVGGNATLSVAMQHCRWQCNIVGGNATLSVAMQHCWWQCNMEMLDC